MYVPHLLYDDMRTCVLLYLRTYYVCTLLLLLLPILSLLILDGAFVV